MQRAAWAGDALLKFMRKRSEAGAMVMKEAGTVKARATEIRNATGEQKNASGEIMKSVSGVSDLAQVNAAGAQSMIDGSGEIKTVSDILNAKVNECLIPPCVASTRTF